MKKNFSPWLHQLKKDRDTKVLTGYNRTEICILGGGISGAVTAFSLLENTNKKIILVEGNSVAHGATGHNAGYVVADFEKPFKDIVKEFGLNIAREGLYEVEKAWDYYFYIRDKIGLPKKEKIISYMVYSNKEYFFNKMNETYLRYGKIDRNFYLLQDCDWIDFIPENFKKNIKFLNESEFLRTLNVKNLNFQDFKGIGEEYMSLGNSALFTETLIKYCLENYPDRFIVYENSFVNSIRIGQGEGIFLDSLRGVLVCEELILCTNGFENFSIYGPYSLEIDKYFHHMVTGIIGYMIGTFTKEKHLEENAGIFFEKDFKLSNEPSEGDQYIYYTKREYDSEIEGGELFCIGGPEMKLKDRRIYKKDHEVDNSFYESLKKFQRKVFNISNEPTFFWHGLMGYTKTGIRIVGRDKRFSELLYNLGCNGVGILPSISGAKRIARIINGEKLEKSIFDPK